AEALEMLRQLSGDTLASGSGTRLTSQAIPEAVGPYRIEGELGAGGVGGRYFAFQPHLLGRGALQVLPPAPPCPRAMVQSFQREACATARLRHPGIVQLYDYSRSGPPYYLATEFVDGIDVHAWARLRGATPVEIADLVARIAEAIDHAHGQGVYHRDLKQGNVLIDAQGSPKVLDFGLARFYRGLEESADGATSDGRGPGTLAY